MSMLNRLPTLIATDGSMPQPCDLPSSPDIQRVNRYGMNQLRLSPSMPAQPHRERDCRIAGPPRAQPSQKLGTSALPPSPKCSHMLCVSGACEWMFPPSSWRRPSAVQLVHWFRFVIHWRYHFVGLRSCTAYQRYWFCALARDRNPTSLLSKPAPMYW